MTGDIDEIVVSAGPRRTRVALLGAGRLVELLVDRTGDPARINDIFLARAGAEAAALGGCFVDLGVGGQGLLARRDGGAKLTEGERLPVQVTREAESEGETDKGPRVTARIRLPGRLAVFEPAGSGGALSARIRDKQARTRLQALADRLAGDGSGRVILRAPAQDADDGDIFAEVTALRGIWTGVEKAAAAASPPVRLWRDSAVAMAVRDHGADVARLTADTPEGLEALRAACAAHAPHLAARIAAAPAGRNAFDAHDIESQIAEALAPRADLPGGGWLSIEPTTALTAIDVNAGGGGERSPGRAALKTNLAAAKEIARQLRLRDIGGIVVVDFINMPGGGDAARLLRGLERAFAGDPADVRIAGLSEFGLVELTRQRRRPALAARASVPCARCGGSGRRPGLRDVGDDLLDAVRRAGAASRDGQVRAVASPAVIADLTGAGEADMVAWLARRYGLRLTLEADAARPDEAFEVATP
jgi:ribonuclease G